MTTATELDTYAQWAWLSGRVGEAIDLYLDIARVYKKFPHVHFKLGYLYLTIQDFPNAVRHFSLEIERLTALPSSTGADRGQDGSEQVQSVTPSKQLLTTRGATQEKAFLFCASLGRSEAYTALKDDAKAENDLLFVSNRGGNTKHMLIAMGVLFTHFGMHLRAEDCFDKCAEIDGNDPDYLIAHAELRLAQKRFANAAKMFEKCRTTCASSSATYHRALIGEGAALLRQNKLQEAVILLLQAMNNLRTCIRNRRENPMSDSSGIGSMQLLSSSSSSSSDEQLRELHVLYHEATNLYGGLCLLKGELKAALDTYYSVIQSGKSSWKTTSAPSSSASSSSFEHFQLPMICVLPGTRNHQGDLVDSTKLSTKNLGEVLRHLDELELRYGPDPCVYFHRANVHKALGEFEQFVHDLSLVESMNPDFLKMYIQKEFFGDFLDLETISWIPLQFVEALHGALERHEFTIPNAAVATSLPVSSPTKPFSQLPSPRDRPTLSNKFKAGKGGSSDTKGKPGKAMHRQLPLVSEIAMHLYFQKRIDAGNALDEYAHVFQLDLFRRLPEARRDIFNLTNLATRQHLSPWEGVVFDESQPRKRSDSSENPARELIKSVLSKFGRNPCVHMIAGIVELELFNASVAYIYFTEAITLINRQQVEIAASGGTISTTTASTGVSSLARRWQQRVLDRVRFYCLIWRSMASRIKIEMEKAVEDLNMAAAIKLDEQTSPTAAVDDPLLLVQRTLIMLLNGHLKSAFKLLRQLTHDMKLVARRRRRHDVAAAKADALSQYPEWLQITDMFGNVGLNSFSLLPLTLEKEYSRLSSPAVVADGGGRAESQTDSGDRNEQAQAAKAIEEEEEAAAAIVRYALSKKTTAVGGRVGVGSNLLQAETLDKFFESGLIKLSSSGSIVQTTPFFQAILSIDESYLPPTNFASLELLKCKEQDFMEEKLYNCFIRLGKRSKWLHKKVRWKFEAFIDANLAHAYLPSDMETLWHRARLLQDQGNYISAINDLSGCLELMNSQITWEKGKKKSSTKMKAVFPNESKRTQWLQLLLERGRLEMALENWEKAIQDLTMVISQVGKSNQLIEASALDARSTSLIHLCRFGHAIQDLQHILSLSKSKKAPSSSSHQAASKTHAHDSVSDGKEDEELLLNCILIGNLYCHLALDQMKISASVSQKNAAFTPFILEQLKAMHLNMDFITKAEEYYDEALKISPEHFLVYYFRGRMLALSAQPKKAAESLSDCLRRHPMFLPALFLRGCIYAQQSLTILALADFYRVRHRSPSYPNLHTSIGFCHFDCGSMTKAVEALTEAVQQDPGDADALYIRGCALQELFVLDNAVKDFSRVLTLNSEHFRAFYQRSACYVLYQRYREALDDLNRAIQIQPEWKEAWNLHAYACFCSGHYEDAVFSYGRAIGLRDATGDSSRGPTPAQRDSLLFLHRSLANMYANHFSAALLDLDLALKRNNENYIAFVAKAFMLLKSGEYDRAMQLLIHTLPHYKKMRLMNPCDVIDSERAKAFKKVQGSDQRSGSFIGNPFGSAGTGFPSSVTLDAGQPAPLKKRQSIESKHPKISTTSDAIFAFRKLSREEQEQRAQAYRQRSVVPKPIKTESSRRSSLIPPRRTLVGGSLAVAASSLETASADLQQQLLTNQVLQRRARNAKFMRAIKKLTFEYRVLKALESATSAKHKKNEQMARVLSDLMRTKSSVPWPKGTLTSNILVWAFNLLGTYHLSNQKVDDALMAFSLAIQAHPYNPVTFFNRGNVFLHIQVLPSAVSGFQDAIDADENCFQAYNNMGVALFELKRLDDAHNAFATGLHHVDERKHKAILLYNLGVIFQSMDKQDEAMEFYQQAITLDGSRTEFFNNRSSILHQQLKFTVALEDYNRALALGTDAEEGSPGAESDKIVMVIGSRGAAAGSNRKSCIEARLNRAQLFITMGNCSSAISDLKVVLKSFTLGRENENKRKVTAGSSSPDRGAAASAAVDSPSSDEALAEELLAFCEKWKDAMRIAVKDFLFGFDAFPSLAAFELYSFFGPQLSLPKAASTRYTDDEGADYQSSSDSQEMMLCPLPIEDPLFFDSERALRHWASGSPNVHEEDTDNQRELVEDDEPDDKVRECKASLLQQPFGNYLHEAMHHCQQSDFESAARCLLRAHYKTALDSPEEYFLIIWRVQVIMKLASCGELHAKSSLSQPPVDLGSLRAITLLHEFLSERQHPEEDDNNDDDQSEGSTFRKKPKRLLRSGPLGANDRDEDELTEQELLWRQQRRVIRADAYSYLGSLYQLNGQVSEARNAFAQALRIRNDHFIALLNFLQLCIVEAEYETALDCILRVFELIFVRLADNNTAQPSEMRGLLNANRSIEVMFLGLTTLRTDSEMTSFGGHMLQLLREYKNLLSAHIQSNTSHIFRKQGALAHLVEEIRQALRLRESTRSSSSGQHYQQEHATSMLDLDEFNRILDDYTASILEQTDPANTFSDEPSPLNQETLQTSLLTEFAQVCDQITRSLPPEALPAKLPKPPPLDIDSDPNPPSVQSSPNSQQSKAARSPKSPSSSSSRKVSSAQLALRRPTMTPLSVRSHRRSTMISNDATLGSSQKNLAAGSNSPKAVRDLSSPRVQLQPQRPQSGPETSQKRQSRQ
ncbi:hypothetical protein Gpo141_00010387 [Globisporangium polare]